MTDKEPDIMEKTGKKNKVFTSSIPGVFQNSDVLFIEYGSSPIN